MTTTRTAPLVAALLLAAGCGGSGATAPDYAVGGTVTGLAGSNLVLHLGPASPGQDLAVTAAGAFQFPGRLPDGSAFTVSVKTQPAGPTQTCQVAGGAGTIAGADAAVTVTCTTNTYTVGGTATLIAGSTLTLQNSGGDDLLVDHTGVFTFAGRVPSGQPFAVTVLQQPTSPPQTCTVTSGTGTVVAADVTSVEVTCALNDRLVAGAVSGLAGATGLVLQVNGAYDKALTADGPFSILTGLATGQAWALTVKTQPTQPWQTCTVANGSGIMNDVGAGGVAVTCVTDAFAVGGTVSGLLQAGLTVSNSGGPPLALDADGSFTFPAPVTSGQAYLVTVESAPATQACTVTGAGGVVGGAAVADVTITCACAPGLASCNGAAPDGCEVAALVDPANCGGCGNACLFANAGASCVGGACQLGACAPGFADCDGLAGTGCEAELTNDPAHCGSCPTACPAPPNAAAACVGGACGLGACAPDFGDCDGNPANGCEADLATDPLHCGACPTACPAPPNAAAACVAGACGLGACAPGFADCDGSAATGCETQITTDVTSCGGCGLACDLPNAAPTCAGGTCAILACTAPFEDCDGSAATGCEVDVATDGLNCGACGHACALPNTSAPQCLSGQCTAAFCAPGFGDCDGLPANGCETSTATDPLNCGSCGAPACAAGGSCVAGQCQLAPSCLALLLAGQTADGVYAIDPDGAGPGGPVSVWCDMTTDGGGWTFFAHVNQDLTPGAFFLQDFGAYSPSLADTNQSFGVGASVYQQLGATELMVTVDVSDTLVALGTSRFIVYQFLPGSLAFGAGPVPSQAGATTFSYRTGLVGQQTGMFDDTCPAELWCPYQAEPDPFGGGFIPVPGAELTAFNGLSLGTYWGSGMAPPATPGVDTFGHDSWWYAR